MFKSQKIHMAQWFWLTAFTLFYVFLFYVIKINTPIKDVLYESELTIKQILSWVIWFTVFVLGSIISSFLGVKFSRNKSKVILEKVEKISIDSSITNFGSSLKFPIDSLPSYEFFIESLNEFIEWKDNEKIKLVNEIKKLYDDVNSCLE